MSTPNPYPKYTGKLPPVSDDVALARRIQQLIKEGKTIPTELLAEAQSYSTPGRQLLDQSTIASYEAQISELKRSMEHVQTQMRQELAATKVAMQKAVEQARAESQAEREREQKAREEADRLRNEREARERAEREAKAATEAAAMAEMKRRLDETETARAAEKQL